MQGEDVANDIDYISVFAERKDVNPKWGGGGEDMSEESVDRFQ